MAKRNEEVVDAFEALPSGRESGGHQEAADDASAAVPAPSRHIIEVGKLKLPRATRENGRPVFA